MDTKGIVIANKRIDDISLLGEEVGYTRPPGGEANWIPSASLGLSA